MDVDQILQKLRGCLFKRLRKSWPYSIAMIGPSPSPFSLSWREPPTPAETLKTFLEWWNACDAPWRVRTDLSNMLQEACTQKPIADLLLAPAKARPPQLRLLSEP